MLREEVRHVRDAQPRLQLVLQQDDGGQGF
jgi:hypothetical protein